MTSATPWLRLLTLTTLLILGGCGGGVGGSGSGTNTADDSTGDQDQQYAEGGMGGSGSGTASGYGSIIVNGNRHFPIDTNADIFVDGRKVTPGTINDSDQGVPLGMTLEYLLAGDANADLTEGTAIGIRANHRAIGAVTGTDPLRVLGQKVLVTSETRGLTEAESEALVPGDVVQLDGHVERDRTVRATRLVEENVSEWQLVGRITSLGEGWFTIGDQLVVLNGAPIEDCGENLEVGERVRVRATEPGDFNAGDPLDTVLRVECLSAQLSLFGELDKAPDVPATLPVAYEGIVTEILSDLDSQDLDTSLQALRDAGEPLRLSLNGQEIHVPLDSENLPKLLAGTLRHLVDNLAIGARIEVTGTLDTDTGVITAQTIRFRDPLIELTGPLQNGVDTTLALLDRPLRRTPGLKDDASLFDSGFSDVQARARGFVTPDGTVYATEIIDSGIADASQVFLHGPVTATDADTDRLYIGETAFDVSTADEISLLDGYALLGTLQKTLLTTTCDLLSLVCDEPDDPELPENLDHAVGRIDGGSWTDPGLEQGTLEIRAP